VFDVARNRGANRRKPIASRDFDRGVPRGLVVERSSRMKTTIARVTGVIGDRDACPKRWVRALQSLHEHLESHSSN